VLQRRNAGTVAFTSLGADIACAFTFITGARLEHTTTRCSAM
jgi:predicted outer membrane lipoprotein